MKSLCSVLLCLVVLLAFAGLADAQTTQLTSVLTWSNSDTTDPMHIIKGPTATGPWTVIASVVAGTLTYTDTANLAGTSSCYTVNNVVNGVDGPASNVACKTFPPNPAVAPVLTVK